MEPLVARLLDEPDVLYAYLQGSFLDQAALRDVDVAMQDNWGRDNYRSSSGNYPDPDRQFLRTESQARARADASIT